MKYDDIKIQKSVMYSIKKDYGFSIVKMEFLTVGEESYSYKIITEDGLMYFAKYCEQKDVTINIDKVNQLLMQLKDLDFIVTPVSIKGVTSFNAGKGKIYVYPYIDGKVVRQRNEMFSEDLVNRLVRIIDTIHNSTDKININIPKENFENNYLERFKKVDKKSLHLWIENKSKIYSLIEKHNMQGSKYKVNPPEFVLTHGDVTGLNIIKIGGGLKLVDWDGAMFAPKERDYIFFNGNPYFSTPHDTELREYYTDTWALDSIIGNFESLLSDGSEKADKNDYIEEIKLYLSYYS